MAITCTIPDAALRRACTLEDASTPAATIARTLTAEGFGVPRQVVTHPAEQRYPHGYAFATAVGDPGVWSAAAVTELLAVSVVSNRAVTPLAAQRTHTLTVV